MFRISLKVLALLSIITIAGCQESNKQSSGDVFSSYASQIIKTPNLTGEPKIDNVIKDSSKLYDESRSLFNDYQESVSGKQSYIDFVNKTSGMSAKDSKAYYDKLSPEKKQQVQAVRSLAGFESLSKASSLLKDAKKCYGSVTELSEYVSSNMMDNPIETGKKMTAIKKLTDQTKSTLGTLNFLSNQYNLLNQFIK